MRQEPWVGKEPSYKETEETEIKQIHLSPDLVRGSHVHRDEDDLKSIEMWSV